MTFGQKTTWALSGNEVGVRGGEVHCTAIHTLFQWRNKRVLVIVNSSTVLKQAVMVSRERMHQSQDHCRVTEAVMFGTIIQKEKIWPNHSQQ